MKARKIRYLILTLMLVILCGAYVGMSFLSPSTMNASGQFPDDGSNVDEPAGDDEFFDYDNDDLYASGDATTEIPSDAIGLVNYAINIYNNGKGSQASLKYTIKNSATYLGINASITQYAIGSTTRNETENLEEVYFYYDNRETGAMITKLLVDNHLLKEGYRAVNVDTANDTFVVTETKVADFNNKTYDLSVATQKEYTVKDGVDRHVAIYSMEFPLEISKNTVDIIKFDERSEKNFTTVKLSYKLAKLPENFNLYYNRNSALEAVTYTSYTFTFRISKKTGKLDKIVREEEFVSYALSGSVQINSKATFEQKFTTMNSPVEVKKVYA